VFGGRPLYGRTFELTEDLPNGPDVAILGHALWRRMFGGDSSVLGAAVTLGDFAWHMIESGSVNNPPYQPIRKGCRAAGLRYDDARDAGT